MLWIICPVSGKFRPQTLVWLTPKPSILFCWFICLFLLSISYCLNCCSFIINSHKVQLANILFKIFASILINLTSLQFHFFIGTGLVRSGYKDYSGLIKWMERVPCVTIFWKCLYGHTWGYCGVRSRAVYTAVKCVSL